MGEAGAERAEHQFRRTRPEIVAGEVGRGIGDDLEVADADAADSAAAFGGRPGLQRRRAERAVGDPPAPVEEGFALLGEVVDQRAHGGPRYN